MSKETHAWASILSDVLGWVIVVGTFGGIVYYIHQGFKTQEKSQARLEKNMPILIDEKLAKFAEQQKDRYIKFHAATTAAVKTELEGAATDMKKQLKDALDQQAATLTKIDTTTTESDQNEKAFLTKMKSQTERTVAATAVVAKKVERKIVNPEDLLAEQKKNANLEQQNRKLVKAKAVPVWWPLWGRPQPTPTPTPRHHRRR